MNGTNVLLAIDSDLNVLYHFNVPGSEWYKHKQGKWQSHAQYAMGQANLDAKEDKKAVKKMMEGFKQTSELYKAQLNSARQNLKASKQDVKSARLSQKASRQELNNQKRDIKDYRADYKEHKKNGYDRTTIRNDRHTISSAMSTLKANETRLKSDKYDLKAAKAKFKSAKDQLKSTKNIYGSINKATKDATIDAIIDSGKTGGWNKVSANVNKFNYYVRNPDKTSNYLLKAAGNIRKARVNAYYTSAYDQMYNRLTNKV